MSAHVLVVDDEAKLADLLAQYLELAGYDVTVLYEGNTVLDTFSREQIDIVLLDWLLPGVDGNTLCHQLRASSDVPIIMITGRIEEAERIAGLETGADDYICKPFSVREVVARVGAMLRRRQPSPSRISGRLFIDDLAHAVFLDGKVLDLTLVEYRLLKTLYANPERAFTRDDLINVIYEDNRIVTDRTVDVHIKNLRHKLHILGLADVITTVYGLGYRWQRVEAGNCKRLTGMRKIQPPARSAGSLSDYQGMALAHSVCGLRSS